MMPPARPLPRRLAKIVEANFRDCRNLGLLLDKYQPWKSSPNGSTWSLQFQISEVRRGQTTPRLTEGSEAKGHWLACSPAPTGTVRNDPFPLEPNRRIDGALYREYVERWKATIHLSGGIRFALRNISRLVLGLGGKGTLEMGLSLHHPAGFPWIPGSALKGLARTWALYRLAESWNVPALDNLEFLRRQDADQPTPLQKLENLLAATPGPQGQPRRLEALNQALRALQTDPVVIQTGGVLLSASAGAIENNPAFQRFRQVFGCPDQAGRVIFFGGMSAAKPQMVSEIMTPHFKRYTEEDQAPTDECTPEPAVYLALEAGQVFWFGLAPRDPSADPALLKAAQSYLEHGLIELGLGAKTSSGMGLFEPVEAG